MLEIEWLDSEVPNYPGDYSILRNLIIDFVKDSSKIPDDDNELFGMIGELISAFPGEKQRILELPDEEVVPALISFLESI
jgi:hypothetical protein